MSDVDSIMVVTRAARLIVADLLDEEEAQRMLIDSLVYQNTMDSLSIMQMMRIQNEQKARLMALNLQLDQAQNSHQQLVSEIEKIRPTYLDAAIPVAGGLAAGILYSGESVEKAAFGLLIYGALFTLKHYGVY